MKKQIKKSELRKLVKEHLSSFMPGVAPLGAMGNATLQDSLDKAAGVEVNKEEFDAILSKVVSQIEKNASIRMTAEAAGVKGKESLTEISGDEEEKDAADDVMEVKLVPEGKKAKLSDKVINDPSTIKLINCRISYVCLRSRGMIVFNSIARFSSMSTSVLYGVYGGVLCTFDGK